MRFTLVALLLQVGVLSGPDPAQMEKAPDLGYRAVESKLQLPDGVKLGAPSSVAITKDGHLMVFNRGDHPLVEVDANGTFVRSLGDGLYVRPHGMRIDAEGNIWTTDVTAHTVRKMDPQGRVLLTLNQPLVKQPNDVAIGPGGEIFVAQGHGQDEPRVSKFDKTGKFITTWGTKGTGPSQFDIAHSIVIDAERMVYVADRQNHRVQIFDMDGRYIKEWKFAGLPCGLFIGPNTQMYLLTGFSGQILKLDRNGKTMAATGQPGKGLGEFGEAHYMALGPHDEIYVADTINAVLHTFVKKDGFIAAQPEDLRPPAGTQQIVVMGDPTKPGMYVVRDVFPPNRVNLPHFHSQDRYVTVLEGTWWVSLGADADSGDPAKMVAMKPGSFVFHPAGGHHFDGTRDEEVTVQIVGMGPVVTTRVNPQPAAAPAR